MIVRGAPNNYQCRVGILGDLELILQNERYQKVLCITGEKSLEAASNYLPNFSTVSVSFETYNGECSPSEVQRYHRIIEREQYDAIIGLGGGKVLDLTKTVGDSVKKDVILIPTLAATCAAWTPLSVLYDDEGSFIRFEYYSKSTFYVLVEPRIISEAPVQFLKAGIGDTLAKWYEAKSLIHSLDPLPVPVQIALQAAMLCKDLLLEKSLNAIEAVEAQKVTDDLLAVVEANILLGGMVGGYGDYYGRVAAAHSVHNALTHIRACHSLLHGEKVAYGILVQLALEKEWDEIELLLPLYEKLGLPASLESLGLTLQKSEELNLLAEKTLLPSESIHYMKDSYKKADIISAIEKLQSYKKITR